MTTSLFAAPLGTPIFRWFDANGNPLAGGQVESYVEASSTPLATYPTYQDATAGTNANPNPVILDANGAAQIWLQSNLFYKIIIKSSVASGSVLQYTQDHVSIAFGSPFPFVIEWFNETGVVSYAAPTQFVVAGVDVTARYHLKRRVRAQVTAGTVYGTVVNTSFAAGSTTVTLTMDGASALDPGLSSVDYGILSYNNPSYFDPRTAFCVTKNGNQVGFAAGVKINTWNVISDPLGEWVAANNNWLCKYTGKYLITGLIDYSNTVASIAHNVVYGLQTTNFLSSWVAGGRLTQSISRLQDCTAGVTTIALTVTGDANTTVYGSTTQFSITRIS